MLTRDDDRTEMFEAVLQRSDRLKVDMERLTVPRRPVLHPRSFDSVQLCDRVLVIVVPTRWMEKDGFLEKTGTTMPSGPEVEEATQPFTAATLEDLYGTISASGGVSLASLGALIAGFCDRPIATADLQSYREGRKPWKKLRDEVVPVERFLAAKYLASTLVRFPLDDKAPDAWFLPGAIGAWRGVEVTGALARAGVEIAKSMADSEVVPGFVALQDDASSASFAKVRKRARVMHSRAEVDRAIDVAIATRLAAKDDAKFEGDILLITAPLGSSPNRSATALQTVHGARAEALPFAEVHVLDGSRRSPIVRLK